MNIHDLIKQHKTLFLPDIGTFFNKDVDIALDMIKKISEANIPVIKAEVLHDANICIDSDALELYYSPKEGGFIKENYRELIERKVLSLDLYNKIFDKVREYGCYLVVSVYDFEGVDFVVNQKNVLAVKIASSNITHKPLIEYVAQTDKTIILDTGHSTLEEISRAINWLNDAGKSDIIVQHSPLAPPTPVDEHNLNFMKTLGNCFKLPYGLSDHHIGDEMIYAATALGASIVEKGICPDYLEDEQDRAHALNISQASIVQKKINNIAKGLGGGKRALDRKREKYISRMGLVAKVDINVGDVLNKKNVGYAFPAIGVPVEYIENVLGRVVTKAVASKCPIKYTDF